VAFGAAVSIPGDANNMVGPPSAADKEKAAPTATLRTHRSGFVAYGRSMDHPTRSGPVVGTGLAMISCPTPLPDDAKMTEVAVSRKRHFAGAADLGSARRSTPGSPLQGGAGGGSDSACPNRRGSSQPTHPQPPPFRGGEESSRQAGQIPLDIVRIERSPIEERIAPKDQPPLCRSRANAVRADRPLQLRTCIRQRRA